MTNRTHTIRIALLLMLTFSARAAALRPLPTDPNIITGKLDNGVKWIFRNHTNPPGKMALMMHVRSGSLNETDAQRGLAHFIEHMCFNGTENFGPGELIPYFESIGMEFGADLNAFTSFDQTVYMLFTPDTEVAQIDKALLVLSDYAFRALMLEEEIDKERGVVLEESRRGKNAFQRLRDKIWPELFEGSRFAERLPIGKDDIIANAPRSEFVDYYRTWYRPENITLIMVGDADHAQFLPAIERRFGEYVATTDARAPEKAGFKSFTNQRAIVATDPELGMCDVSMLNIRPGRPPTTTTEQARVELIEYIGNWIVGRRYEEQVDAGTASFRSARTSVSNFFHDGLLISAVATGEPQDWPKMLEELIIEINRMRAHGCSERELDLAKREILADAERAVKTESTRNASRMIRNYVFKVNDKEPILSAQQELDIYQELLPSITADEVNKAFAKHFEPGTFAYIVEMVEKESVDAPPRDDVLAAARSAWSRTVEARQEDAAPTELLAALPTPGAVVETTVDDDLNVTNASLANGARVHHRYMDYKKDEVFVSINLVGGQIEETKENIGVTEVAGLIIDEPATSRLSATNIRDIMTGKNIQVSGSLEDDTFTVEITGSPDDLEIGLQQAHALLTDGKLEKAAFDNWRLSMLQRIEMLRHMPMYKTAEAATELLSGGDPRKRLLLSKEQVEAQTVGAAQAWFDRLRTTAPIEVTVVGDIKLNAAMPMIERYIGALPKREWAAVQKLEPLRTVARPTGPLARDIEVETMTPQAMAIAGFIAADAHDAFDRRAMQVASNVVTSRLVKRIREDLSLVYSIRASMRINWAYKDSSVLWAAAPCDPEKVHEVVEEVHRQYQEFADNGPTDDELANAKKQILENLDTQLQEPSYWYRALSDMALHERDLNELKTIREDFAAYTKDQVRKTFAKYYVPTRQFSVTGVPKKPETAPEAPTETTKKVSPPAS